jgi:hypothetical protein
MTDKKPDDTENKDDWLEYGEKKEREFVKNVAPKIGVDAKTNPDKKNDSTAIDLIVDEKLTDLKTQETPFFTAQRHFGISPQYCVTFNVNDSERYRNKDTDLDILFWVKWVGETEGYGTEVDRMRGVWKVSHSKIREWIDKGEVNEHRYKRRKNDPKNSQNSYGLDLREMNRLHCFEGPCQP